MCSPSWCAAPALSLRYLLLSHSLHATRRASSTLNSSEWAHVWHRWMSAASSWRNQTVATDSVSELQPVRRNHGEDFTGPQQGGILTGLAALFITRKSRVWQGRKCWSAMARLSLSERSNLSLWFLPHCRTFSLCAPPPADHSRSLWQQREWITQSSSTYTEPLFYDQQQSVPLLKIIFLIRSYLIPIRWFLWRTGSSLDTAMFMEKLGRLSIVFPFASSGSFENLWQFPDLPSWCEKALVNINFIVFCFVFSGSLFRVSW